MNVVSSFYSMVSVKMQSVSMYVVVPFTDFILS